MLRSKQIYILALLGECFSQLLHTGLQRSLSALHQLNGMKLGCLRESCGLFCESSAGDAGT